jgi:hypothetical protein
MQVLIPCGQWGLENDSMIVWMPFYEEQFAKLRQSPHIPGNWTELFSLWLQ